MRGIEGSTVTQKRLLSELQLLQCNRHLGNLLRRLQSIVMIVGCSELQSRGQRMGTFCFRCKLLEE